MSDAVERLVVLLVEVTRRSDAPPDRLHPSGMSWLGGANKVIDRKVQQPDQIPELRGILIHERRHTLARRRRGRGVLLTVLVGAGQKPHLEAAEAVETRQHIGNDLLVRVPDVRAGVDVVDGRRDVVASLVHRHHRRKQCTPRPQGREVPLVVPPTFARTSRLVPDTGYAWSSQSPRSSQSPQSKRTRNSGL